MGRGASLHGADGTHDDHDDTKTTKSRTRPGIFVLFVAAVGS